MCSKKQFTKRDAEGALKQAGKHRKQHKYRKECRIYHCPDCNMWHLTSKETEPKAPEFKPLEDFKKFI